MQKDNNDEKARTWFLRESLEFAFFGVKWYLIIKFIYIFGSEMLINLINEGYICNLIIE